MQEVNTVFSSEEEFQKIYKSCSYGQPQASEEIRSSYERMGNIFEKYISAIKESMFRYAYQCGYEAAKSEGGSMSKLEELMQNEYDAMSFMDAPMSELVSEALKIVRAKITDEEYLEIESNMFSSYNYAEKFGFEQGFMRGIVVAKGGAI